MNLGISALVMLLLAGCGDNDDVWSGGSGVLIGIGLFILIISAILAVRHQGKK